MNQLYDFMSIIKTSGQRGQELMIDSFVIGYLFGKGILKNKEELQTFVEQLKEIKNQIDQSLQYTTIRDDFLIHNLGNLQFLLKNEKIKQSKKNTDKGKGKSKKNNLVQTTPINPQFDIKDQNELIQNQVEETEKQQSQTNSKKSQGQQPQKSQQGVQTRQQLAQSKSDQQKNEQQKNEQQKNE